MVEFFRTYYGPTNRAFANLEEARQGLLRNDLEDLWSRNNQATGDATRVESEYLEVIATRV